jgi:L-fuculose-phosphate aldolase
LAATELSQRRAIVELCGRLEGRRLNQGTSGNVSVRQRSRGADGYLITPSALRYDQMGPTDVVWVGFNGTVRGARGPSSEWRFHQRIYEARPDVGAVVHVHSPSATAFSALREDLPPFHYMVAAAGGSSIRCAPYALFGSEELAAHAVAALDGRDACLLGNHGQITVAAELDDAAALAVEVEALCEQYLLVRAFGPTLLSEKEMSDVLAKFESYRHGTAQ